MLHDSTREETPPPKASDAHLSDVLISLCAWERIPGKHGGAEWKRSSAEMILYSTWVIIINIFEPNEPNNVTDLVILLL